MSYGNKMIYVIFSPKWKKYLEIGFKLLELQVTEVTQIWII